MGLGGTAKKLQKVADMAEDVYAKLSALREEVVETRETVEETAERTAALEAEVAAQRAQIDRLLEANGVDPGSVREGPAITAATDEPDDGPTEGDGA
jgi:ABC-type transporter Mla subunit MlaD